MPDKNSSFVAPVKNLGGYERHEIDEKDRLTLESAVRVTKRLVDEAVAPIVAQQKEHGDMLFLIVGMPAKNGLPAMEGALDRLTRETRDGIQQVRTEQREANQRTEKLLEGLIEAKTKEHESNSAFLAELTELARNSAQRDAKQDDRMDALERNQHRILSAIKASFRWI